MKRCPICNNTRFTAHAHVVQKWLINAEGDYIKTEDDCVAVAHQPDETDIWKCTRCGYYDIGMAFNINCN